MESKFPGKEIHPIRCPIPRTAVVRYKLTPDAQEPPSNNPNELIVSRLFFLQKALYDNFRIYSLKKLLHFINR